MELVVPLPGGEIRAQDTGGDGPALVLVHPGWGDAGIWSQLMAVLPSHYRVLRYDDRGFGRSPLSTTPFTRTDDLRAVLDYAGIRHAVIVGHSGGGGTALSALPRSSCSPPGYGTTRGHRMAPTAPSSASSSRRATRTGWSASG